MRSKLSGLLNCNNATTRNALLEEVESLITAADVDDVVFSVGLVEDCIKVLGRNKSDGSNLSSNHYVLAASILAPPVAEFFSALLRHGFIPTGIRDCVLIPIPKPLKDPSVSDSYRPIALAPNLSKILERCILLRYRSSLLTSDLQFGFKEGFSTDLCTGVLKNVVSQYLQGGSNVYGCFLDASKAFDRVNHTTLFKLLIKRDLPPTVLRFLFSWYRDQELSVRWNSNHSAAFNVTNGVRQGGVLSPILFSVYIDELLQRLSLLGIGCHLGNHSVCALGYADDIALLAPSPSAMRILLRECEEFASEFEITFNASKTQLICFSNSRSRTLPNGVFRFIGSDLQFSDTVTHLGHILHCTLDDVADVTRVRSSMCRKANYLLHTFSGCSMSVKTKLIVTHCLSLFGCVLWRLDCKMIRSLETSFNNILRKIWRLPRLCHTRILHCVAGVQSLFNTIPDLFSKFISRAVNSKSPLIRSVFTWASSQAWTAVGGNLLTIGDYSKVYSSHDTTCGEYVRDIKLGRLVFNTPDETNTILYSICCD